MAVNDFPRSSKNQIPKRAAKIAGAVAAVLASAGLFGTESAFAALPTATGRSFNLAESGYTLWIPNNYVQRGSQADLLIQYLGDNTFMRNNLAYSNLNAILLTVNIGAGSSAYQTPYQSDPNLFANINNEALTIVRNQSDFADNLTWDKIGVSSFSAGYGAVRQILTSPTYTSEISNYAALDTIYASYTSSTDETPLASQMVDFKSFALAAKNGTKTMVLMHTGVQTYTYANTQQTADNIMSYIGVTPVPYTTPGLSGETFYRTANSGNFTMYGTTGSDANAHDLVQQTAGQFWSELNLAANDVLLGNGTSISTDMAIPQNVTYSGTTGGSTLSGMVQLPRRGGTHTFNVADSSAATDLTLSGVLWGVGPEFLKTGAGTMQLSGTSANTFSGLTRIDAGMLQLNKTAGVNAIASDLDIHFAAVVRWLANNQVPDTATLTGNGVGSTIDLNGHTETAGAVSLFAGTVSLGTGSLTLGGAITANSTLNVAYITGPGTITAASLNAQGSLTRNGGGLTKLTTSSLAVSPTRRLDLADTKLITKASLASVTSLIQTGRNGGAWNGAGGIITSMTAASAANQLTTLAVATAGDIGKTSLGGASVAPTDTLVMYTYAGDANLSGKIDGDDYFRIDSGYANHLTGYENGDFNYDGKIDADDYFLIDRNYARQTSTFSAGEPVGDIQAVPEPSGYLGLLGLLGLLGFTSRRRSRDISR